jgi:glutathione S-transferase
MAPRPLARRIPGPKNLRDVHAFVPSVLRLGRGLVAWAPAARTPEIPLELHEFEGCPFCRKVRDALTELDIGYVSRAAGKGADRTRLMAEGGKAQVPFLVDPNHGVSMYESEAIVDDLWKTWGGRRRPLWMTALAPLDTVSSALASASRATRGSRVRMARSAQPAHLLELWSFEASPYCRKVREVLSELALDVRIHNVGKGGRRRAELVALGGKMQVPYLVDPNTGVAMYESDDIVAYLRRTYG